MTARRIVLAIDASLPSVEAARTAAEVAAALGAELLGVFVEDLNLLRLAALPFARELRVPDGAERPLEQARLEAELRALAAWARAELERAATAAHVRWSFEVRRAALPEAVLAAAGESDLLVLGSHGHAARGRPGSTARAAAARSTRPVLLHPRGAAGGRGILLVNDLTPGNERAEAAAGALGGRLGGVAVLALTADPAGASRLAAALQRSGQPPTPVRWAGGATLDHLLSSARELRPALLVLPGASPLLSGEGLERLIAEAPSPVLLVR
ncbi:MAG: universal stress protein [Deltaproteobacteria bacterium]|nr:universal stress protein [Deltaproteobacteria bacterium]